MITINRAVVINLDRRGDRLQTFLPHWVAVAGPHAGMLERLRAVDNPDDPTAGCWASHIGALRGVGAGPVAQGYGLNAPTLIMEDDAVFAPSLCRLPPPITLGGQLTLDLPVPPPDWQVLRLGGAWRGQHLGAGWNRTDMAQHTHTYIARRPVDLAALLLTQPHRRNVAEALAGLRGQYRIVPAAAGQAAGRSDIAGALFGERWWDDDTRGQ